MPFKFIFIDFTRVYLYLYRLSFLKFMPTYFPLLSRVIVLTKYSHNIILLVTFIVINIRWETFFRFDSNEDEY